MSERSTLGVVIRRRRQELGWTQEELAERITADGEYVRQSEISRIENGKIELPRRERLVRLAEVLDLPLGELLARSGWAGADLHFQQNGIAEPAPDNSPEQPPPSLDRSAERMAVSEHHDDARDRRFGRSTDPDAMSALRRALSAMRDESDRLIRNRDRSVEILERICQPLADAADRPHDD